MEKATGTVQLFTVMNWQRKKSCLLATDLKKFGRLGKYTVPYVLKSCNYGKDKISLMLQIFTLFPRNFCENN